METKKGHKKRKEKKAPVYVRVLNQAAHSAHVIDLNERKKTDNVWDKVPVYSEKVKKTNLIRSTVNLAELVRYANEQINLRNEAKKINFELKKKAAALALTAKILRKKEKEDFYRKISSSMVLPAWSKARRLVSFEKLVYSTIVFVLIFITSFPTIGYYNRLKAAQEVAVEEGTRAFFSLQASTVAAFQSDLEQAENELTRALQSFSNANNVVEKDFKLLIFVAKLLPVIGTRVESRQSLLTAGNHLALGNTYFIKGIEEAEKEEARRLTDRFVILQNHLRGALAQYREALVYLNKVDLDSIPLEYQKLFVEFKVLLAAFIDDAEDLVELSTAFNTIFGGDSFKRYLIVFQNHHELRATGGFMGSFAVLDVQKGKILNIDVPGGGTYDLRGQLTRFVKPPLPLQLLNNRWEFQDANWFPDFAASAQKMEWFYENARGATVDGVIAVNASVLERVLKVLGPVEAGDILFERGDAIAKLQQEVEVGYDRETEQPKAVLAQMLNELILTLQNVDPSLILRLLMEFNEALNQKEIQLYINDDNTQDGLRAFGWTGELAPVGPYQDYLSVIHTNIQGQKSDAKIEQLITHEAVIDEEQNIIDTVVIERTHTGEAGEQFYGGANISFVRVYVPEGAELLDAGGFTYPPEYAFRVPEVWYDDDQDLALYEKEQALHLASGTRVTREFGKTVFGNWSVTMPGEKRVIYFKYKLPFKAPASIAPENNLDKWQSVFVPAMNYATSRYSLFVQKQSGTNSNFSSTIIYPVNWLPVWKSDDDMDLALNGARYETTLRTDTVLGIAVEKQND